MKVPRFLVALALPALVVSTPGSATTYHVKADGSGDYATIQAAIDAAADGDVIALANGTFSGTGNFSVRFRGKSVVVQSEADDPALCIVDPGRNFGFLFWDGEGAAAGLKALTVRGDRCVDCEAVSPTFRNCIFSSPFGNGAELTGGTPTFTGCVFVGCGDPAVFVEAHCRPVFTDCEFRDNPMGAMRHSVSFPTAPPEITVKRCRFEGNGGYGAFEGSGAFEDCVFKSNQAGTGAASSCSVSRFVRCQFEGNSVTIDGGAVTAGGEVTLEGCSFTNNSAGERGGALFVRDGSDLEVRGCTFTGNNGGQGGAVALASFATVAFDSCEFVGNSATEGGALRLRDSGVAAVSRSIIRQNTATWGGAIYLHHSALSGSSTTLVANDGVNGGAIYISGNPLDVQLDTSIVAFNRGSAGLVCDQGLVHPAVTCCDFFGNEGDDDTGCMGGVLASGGNLTADPLFCGLAAGDVRLCENSPCLSGHNGCGVLIGARDQGCGACVSPTDRRSWGWIKAAFR